MRLKMVLCLIAILMMPLAAAFAGEAPAVSTASAASPPLLASPASSCAATPLSPLDGAVQATWCSDMHCDNALQCNNICGPFMCGGKCYVDASCGWKYCHCLQCP